MKMSKQATYYNRLVEGFLSIGRKTSKSNKFQTYYVIDQIKGTFACEFTHNGEVVRDPEVDFDSKWLYKIDNLESNDLKKYRKRTLFDFQFWARGNFFPIRNFAAEMADL